MPYVPKFRHLFQILLRIRNSQVAEGLYLEGTWYHDQGDEESALMAFSHARLLDNALGGAFYNFAALTEKKRGTDRQTLKAWEEYLEAAERDSRQPRDTIEKVRGHVEELRATLRSGKDQS